MFAWTPQFLQCGMRQHPVKIFETKKVSSTTKSLGCWSMPRDEMWVWCQKKTPKQWDHIWFRASNIETVSKQNQQTSKKHTQTPQFFPRTFALLDSLTIIFLKRFKIWFFLGGGKARNWQTWKMAKSVFYMEKRRWCEHFHFLLKLYVYKLLFSTNIFMRNLHMQQNSI